MTTQLLSVQTHLEQDAARYRWLRQGNALTVRCAGLTIITGANPDYIRKYGDALDIAVDAAITKEQS